MNRLTAFAIAAIVASATVSTGGERAAAADPVSAGFDTSGACSQAWVLRTIEHRFRHQVRHVPNLPDVTIGGFYDIYERQYRPASVNHPIGRTYCGATLTLSNGFSRSIHYLIEEGQGFAGIGDNVEFCVAGFDRWNVYNGACRILR